MPDHLQGIKRDVAEVKFLIHDLRVERFIDEVIHFHVALDTDLELYSITDLDVPTGDDLLALRARAAELRTVIVQYEEAVKSFAPPETILELANLYITSIHDLCELILHPLWVHIEEAMTRLPQQSWTVQSKNHYRNTIRWLCGVYYRIEHFWAEQRHEDVNEVFDIAGDIEDYVHNVVYSYVTEKSAGRVELEVGRLEPAVVEGNRFRFRRMYFNLVMNSVDAMGDKNLGVIRIEEVTERGEVILTVRDDGSGMTEEKKRQLLTDRESLDGELHSLGFVFVRQTVDNFGGDLTIESALGKGTMITVKFPYQEGVEPPPRRGSLCREYDVAPADRRPTLKPLSPKDSRGTCGFDIYSDYRKSTSDYPGCIFAIGITEEGRLEMFSHKPYERLWNIGHEDLSPMFFAATVRGRLEENELREPVVILKGPQSMSEYFEFKEVPAESRNEDRFIRMVHDELVRIARRLIGTGLPEILEAQVASLERFIPELAGQEPFALEVLAGVDLSTEG